MKIQCSCGTKYAFDITPEMAQTPIQFVCQSCGLDSSDYVNELIRRELTSRAPLEPPLPPSLEPATVEAHHAPGTARVRVQAGKATQPAPAPAGIAQICTKHPRQAVTHHCLVCQKPLCAKCMELLGYVCSPLCAAKAETKGIVIPAYQGKKTAIEARHWQKVGLIVGVVAVVIGGLLGFWFWYAWFGSVPKPMFSIRFAEPAYSGGSAACGTNQIVFLHGDTLARHDMKTKKEIWSRRLIDDKQLSDAVAREIKELKEHSIYGALGIRSPSESELTENLKRMLAARLQLHVRSQNLWVTEPATLFSNDWKIVRYDWDSGKPLQEIFLSTNLAGLISRGDEMLARTAVKRGQETVTHVNLLSGERRVETIGQPAREAAAVATANKSAQGAPKAAPRGKEMAGLPTGIPGADEGKPLDPEKVARQAQQLPLPEKIALPATLSSELHQERILAETKDPEPARAADTPDPNLKPEDRIVFVPGEQGIMRFTVRMIEQRYVTRNAMKSPPAKSVMNGNFTVAQTAEAANEILNQMQREHGGDTVSEDQSRYQVTVRLSNLEGSRDWTGEVVGPPSLHPLKTVNVVAAGKTVVVLDRTNKKLWQSALSYNIEQQFNLFGDDEAAFGQGPCVEHGDALYVFDEAVLTAFDLKTGTVRWRLPSVGTVGLLFDDKGMLYVNTTTASPERIKYSRQIDISRVTSGVILKINPRSGKILWAETSGSLVSCVSGKFIYTLSSHQADENEANAPYRTGLETPSHVTIRRLNPDNGRMMWQHYEQRAPIDVQFANTSIRIVFKKEVEVLKFLSF